MAPPTVMMGKSGNGCVERNAILPRVIADLKKRVENSLASPGGEFSIR
jgi:hypothetical protein